MLPIPSNKNQESCSPISSNCVIWQGPDIPCINLCRGDSVTDVTAMLAHELCTLLDQLSIPSFNLECFDLSCANVNNIHDLIQFILDQLCALNGCCADNVASAAGGTGNRVARTAGVGLDCPDCTVTVAQCFWYFDAFGNQITTMNIQDYAVAIGNKVCNLVTELTNLTTLVNNQQVQIDYILTNYAPTPPVTLPTFYSTCLTDKIPSIPPGGVSITDMVNGLQEAFCELRGATGMPSELLTSINQQCINLDTSTSLTFPGTNMGSLPGWIGGASYFNLAAAVNNMWITICDMRTAVRSIQDTCCNTSCDDVSIMLQLTFTAPSSLAFYFSGSAPGFQDCVSGSNSGSFVTITDAYGNFYNTYVPVITNLNVPYTIDLSGTPLNTSTNLTVKVNLCVKTADGLIVCERCIEQMVVNTTPCPELNLSATSSSVTYSINNTLSGTVTYQVDLRVFGDPTIVATYNNVVSSPSVVSNTFGSLTPSTTYSLTVTIIVNGATTNVCNGLITTGALTCNPPTTVSGSTNQYIIT